LNWVTLGRGRAHLVLFAVPAVIYVLAWRIAPALYTLALGFTEYNLVYDSGPRWNGLENYVHLFRDRALLEAIWISSQFAVVATALEILIGLASAAFFDSDPPRRNVLLGIFLLPMIMAPVVVGTAWSALFDQSVGPVPYLFELIHGPQIQWLATPLSAFVGLVVADAWEWSPFLTLLLFAAMQAIPRELFEAARVDGAAGIQLFVRIVLPQVRGMIVVAGGLRFMDAFLELDKVFVMTGGGPGTSTQFVSMYVYKQAFQGYALGYTSTVITALLALLGFVYAFYLMRYGRLLRRGNA
jgi:multiple sugar transport system permease protein